MSLEFTTERHFPDVFGVSIGLKPVSVSKLDNFNANEIKNFELNCKKEGLFCRIIDWKKYSIKHKINTELVKIKKDENLIAFFSFSKDLVNELIPKYMTHDVTQIGKLLGYPSCCVKAWIKRTEDYYSRERSKEEGLRNDFNFSHYFYNSLDNQFKSSIKETKKFSSYLNTFSVGNRLIPHHACLFDCEKSVKFAEESFEKLKELNPTKATWVKNDLNLSVLVHSFYTFLKFEKSENKLEFKDKTNRDLFLDGYVRLLGRKKDPQLQEVGTTFEALWNKNEQFKTGDYFKDFCWIEWDALII